MSIECYKARWFLWASLSVIGVVLFVIGIPSGILFALFLSKKKNTLEYPSIDYTNDEHISSAEIQSNVRKTNAFFRNRVAFGRYVLLPSVRLPPSPRIRTHLTSPKLISPLQRLSPV